jgi:ATPase (AAA+ superfamily)-like protein
MSTIIDRKLYLDQLINKKQNGLIKIITGIRRCGKSFLLFNLFYNHLIKSGVKESNIISLILDDDKNRKYRNPDNLSEYLYSRKKNKKEMYFILLDEVQFAIKNDEIKNYNEIRLYGILNGLLRLNNVDIYITESNSKFLSSDVLTGFRGRGD